MGLKVKRFLTSVNDANCYICWCENTGHGAIVDPAEFTEDMKRTISSNNIRLQLILLTHAHYDHNNAVDDVKREHPAPVIALHVFSDSIPEDGENTLRIGEEEIQMVAVPGHTEDSAAFIGKGLAFVGDALFAAAVGGTGDRAHFEQETQNVREKILSLPECAILYPGHGPATTVAIEKSYNPFFFYK